MKLAFTASSSQPRSGLRTHSFEAMPKKTPSPTQDKPSPPAAAAPPVTGASRQPPAASLKQLAHHLGLSQTTVSRVINRSAASSRIPESTRARVLKAAAALGYKANPVARALRSRRSATVGVMVPEISEGYSTMVLSGIEEALLSEGYFYFVVSHRHRQELLDAYPQLLLARAVEGIIAIDTPLPASLGVPVAAVSGHQQHENVINIQLDHAKAARLALEHLHGLGHRRIAYIKGQDFSSDTRMRWKALREEAIALGIAMDPALTTQLQGFDSGTSPGLAAAQQLLARGKPFTALVAFNDLSAIGAIAALREAGLRVPDDVSVVGFDDIQSAATNNPALTTVQQPLRQMGALAASTLLRLIRGEAEPRHILRVHPGFICRQSTAPVPPNGGRVLGEHRGETAR